MLWPARRGAISLLGKKNARTGRPCDALHENPNCDAAQQHATGAGAVLLTIAPYVALADSMTLPLAMLAVLAVAALAAFGAICVVAGALWMKARAAAALRLATDDSARLLALADHWIWETDTQHRLKLWRAPAQRPSGWCAAPEIGARLADIARPLSAAMSTVSAAAAGSAADPRPHSHATPLSRQMDAHAPVPAQRVTLRLGGGAQAWLLRGEPCHDEAGRFTGYIGSASPVGEADAAEFADAALTRLLPHLEATVLLFRRADDTAPWRLGQYGDGALAAL